MEPSQARCERRGWRSAIEKRDYGNSEHTGIWHYGKSRSRKARQAGEPRRVYPPKEEQISVAIQAIVDEELYQLAQRRFAQNLNHSTRNSKAGYLLTSHLRCASCGRAFLGHKEKNGTLQYVCRGRQGYPKRVCFMPVFYETSVDRALWVWLTELVTQPGRVRQLREEQQAERENHNAPLYERLTIVQAQIEEIKQERERLMKLFLKGRYDENMLDQEDSRLSKLISGFERERASLEKTVERTTIAPEELDTIELACGRISTGMAQFSRDERREVYDLREVEARLGIENDQRVTYASCILERDKLIPIAARSGNYKTGKADEGDDAEDDDITSTQLEQVVMAALVKAQWDACRLTRRPIGTCERPGAAPRARVLGGRH